MSRSFEREKIGDREKRKQERENRIEGRGNREWGIGNGEWDRGNREGDGGPSITIFSLSSILFSLSSILSTWYFMSSQCGYSFKIFASLRLCVRNVFFVVKYIQKEERGNRKQVCQLSSILYSIILSMAPLREAFWDRIRGSYRP